MKLKRLFVAAALLATAGLSYAQTSNLPISSDRYLASDYGQWQAKVASGPTTTGAVTYTMTLSNAPMKNGRVVVPFATNAPLLIGTSNQETATPSAVSCPAGVSSGGTVTCTVTVTVVNAHGAGELIQSGTFGLQEAIDDASQTGSGVVAVNRLWQTLGGTTAMLQAASFALNATFEPTPVVVEDVRGVNGTSYWYGAPGLTLATTPTALTTAGGAAATLTTSTTGGAIATGQTPRFCIAQPDQFGSETACSADAAATATLVDGATATNSYGVTCPALTAGLVGCRLYVSATGGTTQTETLATAVTCATAAPLSPLPNTCGPGVMTLTALPATTNAGPPQGTSGAATALSSAHTTVVAKQSGIPPTMLPFNDTAAPGYWPVSVTSATTLVAGFDVMGELQYPAGFFNSLGSVYRICGGGVVTPSAATVAGTWNIRIGPRENSAGTSGEHAIVPFGFVASNQWTAALSHFDFCTDITVSTTGTSGVLEGSGTSFCVVVAAGNDGAGVDTCVGAFNAASTATDLTLQGVIQVSYVQTAASWTLPQLRYLTVRRL